MKLPRMITSTISFNSDEPNAIFMSMLAPLVHPLYNAEQAYPECIASCVLVHYDGQGFLATAGHALDNGVRYSFGHHGFGIPTAQGLVVVSDDVGLIPCKSGDYPLPFVNLHKEKFECDNRWLYPVGYPVSKNKKSGFDPITKALTGNIVAAAQPSTALTPKMLKELTPSTVVCPFGGKKNRHIGADGTVSWVKQHGTPKGFSGGGLFSASVVVDDHGAQTYSGRFEGILHTWLNPGMLGVSSARIVELIEKNF